MRRGRILILVGLILACGTAAVIFVLLQNVSQQAGTTEVPKEEVVVAAQPIEEDQSVDGRLEMKALPVESIPEGALRTTDGTAGMLAKGPIPQGQIIQTGMLQTKEEQMREGKLGQLVEAGYIGVALPISELSSVSYGILPDDRIDILMTFSFIDIESETQSKEPLCPPVCPAVGGGETGAAGAASQIPRRAAQVILQDVRVLGVGRWTYGAPEPEQTEEQQAQGQQAAPEPPQFITVMLKAQDALVLKLARESGAVIDLAVRQEDDHQLWTTDQVSLDYLLAHYGLRVPDKQNYSLDSLPPAATP